MNSPSDENKKQQNEESFPPEGETNVLEASTVKCFPAVKRSFRQKQCNWRWRWKYFTRYVFMILSFYFRSESVVLLELAAINANRWYFTCTIIFYGNKLLVVSDANIQIVLCNVKYDLRIQHYHPQSSVLVQYVKRCFGSSFCGRMFLC